MIAETLYNSGSRQWTFFGRDPDKKKELIDTNTYLVTQGKAGVVLDPGGLETFPEIVSIISKKIDLQDIEALFASHQDPDIISSLSLWLEICGDLKVYASWVWGGFIPHFGGGKALTPIPDEGGILELGDSRDLQFIPAHYLHSSGNFNLYDPTAQILFSGDIGGALLPEGAAGIYVEDFDEHVRYMEGFHRRWMPSNQAKDAWIEHVSRLNVTTMCPQHGSIFRGDQVKRFLEWFHNLEVGSAVDANKGQRRKTR